MKTALVILTILIVTPALAHEICSEQTRRCIAYSAQYRPYIARYACIGLYRICLRTGVWDGRDIFPFGGALIRGMIRR